MTKENGLLSIVCEMSKLIVSSAVREGGVVYPRPPRWPGPGQDSRPLQ